VESESTIPVPDPTRSLRGSGLDSDGGGGGHGLGVFAGDVGGHGKHQGVDGAQTRGDVRRRAVHRLFAWYEGLEYTGTL